MYYSIFDCYSVSESSESVNSLVFTFFLKDLLFSSDSVDSFLFSFFLIDLSFSGDSFLFLFEPLASFFVCNSDSKSSESVKSFVFTTFLIDFSLLVVL